MREYWTNNTYTHLPHLLPHSHLLLFSFLGRIAMCIILGLVARLSLLGRLLNTPLGPIGIHNASLVFIRVLLQGLARASTESSGTGVSPGAARRPPAVLNSLSGAGWWTLRSCSSVGPIL